MLGYAEGDVYIIQISVKFIGFIKVLEISSISNDLLLFQYFFDDTVKITIGNCIHLFF